MNVYFGHCLSLDFSAESSKRQSLSAEAADKLFLRPGTLLVPDVPQSLVCGLYTDLLDLISRFFVLFEPGKHIVDQQFPLDQLPEFLMIDFLLLVFAGRSSEIA